jgi:hypothetical protein
MLAVVAATGLLPNHPWIDRRVRLVPVLVAPSAVVLLPFLAAARASGQLAAGPRAVVLVLHRRHGVAAIAGPYLALVAGLLSAAQTGLPAAIPLPVAVLVLAGCVQSGAVGAASAWFRRRARGPAPRSKTPVPTGTVEMTCAAAWPRHHGHATRLWDQLPAALQPMGRPVAARAATADLAQTYARIAGTYAPARVDGDVVSWTPLQQRT